MAISNTNLTVRDAVLTDGGELCHLLNVIIEIGGTTANQQAYSESTFVAEFISPAELVSNLVAIDEHGAIAGFQTLGHDPDLAEGWVDIATFARVAPKVAGVGTALFAHTRSIAARSGFVAINATIRADNTGGLAYYEKMGFETYSVKTAVPLHDGTPVDRVSKRCMLA